MFENALRVYVTLVQRSKNAHWFPQQALLLLGLDSG